MTTVLWMLTLERGAAIERFGDAWGLSSATICGCADAKRMRPYAANFGCSAWALESFQFQHQSTQRLVASSAEHATLSWNTLVLHRS
jgi:hypothetical protein